MESLNIVGEIAIKIFVTVVVSILTWLFLKFTDKVIIPWFKSLMYNGAEIDGIWTGTTVIENLDTKFHEHFILEQSGQCLTGSYTVKSEQQDKTYSVSTYKIKGEVIQNYVTLTCTVDSKREIGIINLLLHISSGGDEMQGSAIWINRAGNEIKDQKNITFHYKKN